MSLTDLQGIAEHVINRARVQGFVVPREIRAALAEAGWPETQWKDVLALAQAFLHYRHGRYYYISVANVRPRNDQIPPTWSAGNTAGFHSSSPPKS